MQEESNKKKSKIMKNALFKPQKDQNKIKMLENETTMYGIRGRPSLSYSHINVH
jgi:hypothetical protein